MGRRKKAAETPESETVYPIVTKDKRRQTVIIDGKPEVVDEVIITDWGPKMGVTRCYLTHCERHVDWDAVNRVLNTCGYELVYPKGRRTDDTA